MNELNMFKFEFNIYQFNKEPFLRFVYHLYQILCVVFTVWFFNWINIAEKSRALAWGCGDRRNTDATIIFVYWI